MACLCTKNMSTMIHGTVIFLTLHILIISQHINEHVLLTSHCATIRVLMSEFKIYEVTVMSCFKLLRKFAHGWKNYSLNLLHLASTWVHYYLLSHHSKFSFAFCMIIKHNYCLRSLGAIYKINLIYSIMCHSSILLNY